MESDGATEKTTTLDRIDFKITDCSQMSATFAFVAVITFIGALFVDSSKTEDEFLYIVSFIFTLGSIFCYIKKSTLEIIKNIKQ